MRYPLYGKLASIGAYAFLPDATYLIAPNNKRARTYAHALNQAQALDMLAGGVAPQNPEVQYQYWVVATGSNASSEQVANTYVEGQYQAMLAQRDSLNLDGTSGELQTLTAVLADGSFTSAPCALIDVSFREGDRGPYHCMFTLTIALLGPFTP